MSDNLARLAGTMEHDVGQHGGLRNQRLSMQLGSTQTDLINAQPVGGAASAAVTTWTALTIGGLVVANPSTLCAHIAQASPAASSIRLRVRGTDQFGEYLEELTPVVTLEAKTNNYVYLARVFAQVTDVSFQSTGLDIAGDTVSLGQRFDWTRTIDGTNHHHAGRNLGIGIGLRLGIRPRGSGKPTAPRFLQRVPERIRATASLGVSGDPANLDTCTIDGVVYTFTTAAPSAAYEVQRGAGAAATMQNLAYAINADSLGAGTAYGTGTVAHPTVRIVSHSGTTVLIEAWEAGAPGNLIVLAEASTSLTWGSVLHMVEGTDTPVEILGLTVYDHLDASSNATMQLKPRDYLIGYSESGWTGSVEKLHIHDVTAAPAWAVANDVMVEVQTRTTDSRF